MVGLVGLFLLVHMVLNDRPSKQAAPPESLAASEAPPSVTVAPAPIPIPPPAPPMRFDSGANPPSHTTETVLSAQGSDCLACAQRSGCLDPKQSGSSCEELLGQAAGCGPGVSERDICFRTLNDVFTSKCAETLQEVPCLCGATDVVQCLDGTETPTGPVYADYACDFNTTDVAAIERDFRDTNFGAGNANALIQCVAGNGCGCFGN